LNNLHKSTLEQHFGL